MEILLVEDNETLAKGIIYSLEQQKFNVTHKIKLFHVGIIFLTKKKKKLQNKNESSEE